MREKAFYEFSSFLSGVYKFKSNIIFDFDQSWKKKNF